MQQIGELKKLVESRITGLDFPETPRDLYNPIRYMMELGGKRMRPVLSLAACQMFGGDVRSALDPAVGLEVFHNFTLLHDDIMDKAPVRRGQPTVHEKWNPDVAILSGDTMFVKSYMLMMQAPDHCLREVLGLFCKTAVEVCEGQQLDMDFEQMEEVGEEEYIHMISNKTAVLLAAALQTGALIAGASTIDCDHLYAFGRATGIAFQLKDDILDVYGESGKVGKQQAGDILANKKTILTVKAMQLAQGEDKAALMNWFSAKNFDAAEKVSGVLSIYEKLQVKAIAEALIVDYFETAIQHLDKITVAETEKQLLRDFAGQLMVREH